MSLAVQADLQKRLTQRNWSTGKKRRFQRASQVRLFELRKPRSVAAVTLLDRPYRRLVDDLPVKYVGFVVPDELFVGFGFDLEEKWRHLPDLHLLRLEV